VHIVTDPLATPDDPEDFVGWVTFWCQSKIGFQYNIGATDLNPLSKYSVMATGIQAALILEPDPAWDPGDPSTWDEGVAFVDGMWIQIVGEVNLDLGTFKTDVNGRGGVNGVSKLDSGFLYSVAVLVFDVNDLADPVLVPGVFFGESDTNGFIVY
jgi:hypothetical protein